MKLAVSFLFTALISPNILAGDLFARPVEGQMYIVNEDSLDGLKDIGEIQLFLSGENAEFMYKNMKVNAKVSGCHSDGSLEKRNGLFVCEKWPSAKYICYFGVDIENQKLAKVKNC